MAAATDALQGELLGVVLTHPLATLHVAVMNEAYEALVFRITVCRRGEGAVCEGASPELIFDLPSRAPGTYGPAKITTALYERGSPVPVFEKTHPRACIELVDSGPGRLRARIAAQLGDPGASWLRGEVPVESIP